MRTISNAPNVFNNQHDFNFKMNEFLFLVRWVGLCLHVAAGHTFAWRSYSILFSHKVCGSCEIDHKIGTRCCWQMTHSNKCWLPEIGWETLLQDLRSLIGTWHYSASCQEISERRAQHVFRKNGQSSEVQYFWQVSGTARTQTQIASASSNLIRCILLFL